MGYFNQVVKIRRYKFQGQKEERKKGGKE